MLPSVHEAFDVLMLWEIHVSYCRDDATLKLEVNIWMET